MNDVHAKVAAWYELHAVKKEFESRVREVLEHDAADGMMLARLEAEMKAVASEVDKAFHEASAAVHVHHRQDRPAGR